MGRMPAVNLNTGIWNSLVWLLGTQELSNRPALMTTTWAKGVADRQRIIIDSTYELFYLSFVLAFLFPSLYI